MSDNIDGIFDHLDPDDFNRATSAADDIPRTNEQLDAFNAFVNEQLRTLRTGYIAASGNLNPIAIVASPTVQRVFAADDDETMGQWIDRVAREAKQIGAIWTFVSKKTLVATKKVADRSEVDVNDPSSAEWAQEEGLLKVGIVWYGERREAGQHQRRVGTMEEVEPGRLGPSTETSSQPIPLFARILA